MCRKYKSFVIILFGFFVMATIMFVNNNQVFARTVTEVQSSIVDKAVLQGVYNCYNKGYVQGKIPSLQNFNGIGFLVDGSKSQGENDVPLVTGINSMSFWESNRYAVKDSGLSCKQLFQGGSYSFGGYNDGILQAMKKPVPDSTNADSVVGFMKNMGYDTTTSGASACYNLVYNGSETTNSVCLENGVLKENEDSGYDNVKLSVRNGNKVCLMIKTSSASAYANGEFGCKTLENASDFNSEWLASVPNKQAHWYDTDECSHAQCTITFRLDEHTNETKTYSFTPSGGPVDSLANTSATFRGNNSAIAALDAVSYLAPSGSALAKANLTESDLRFDDIEKRVLYQSYLQSIYGITPDCNVEEWNKGSYDQSIQWFDGSASTKTCYFDRNSAKNINVPVNGVNSNGFLSYESIKKDGSSSAYDNLLVAMGALRTEYTNDEVAAFNESVANSTTGGMEGQSQSKDATCLNSGAGNSLGWILCPILDMLSSATEFLYNTMIKPNLEIQPQLFAEQGDNGTRQAWGVFQGIANVFIIVLFLIVIFSQLTGVGIDNYGIKRTLPKIILVAILMNISYYICIIAIDVSNISGNSIQALFDGMNPTIQNSNFSFLNSTGSAIASVGITGAVVDIAATAGVFETATLIALLPTILSVVVAVFFLFIILSARQAAVVVMVVIAPLAIVCYMLPNTKRFFDRWVKIMEALLLVYPICGLIVAGGNYVSKLLLASGFGDGGLMNALTAMLIGIIPVFFIPSVLKRSMSGLGDLGNKISNFGGRLGRGAASGLRNADAYQSALQSAQERKNMHLAGRRWNPNANDGKGKWEEDTSRLGRARNRIARSRFGQAAGLDRLQGRRSQRAEVDRSTAETERQNANVDIMNAQRGKNQDTLEDRTGDASGYAEYMDNLAPGEYEEQLQARRIKAQDDAVDRLSDESGKAKRHLERARTEPLTNRRIRSAGTQELARQTEGNRLNDMEGAGLEALQARAIEANGGDIRSVTGTAADARDRARLARLQRQGKVDAGVEQTNLGYETDIARNARLQRQGQINAGAKHTNIEYETQTAANQRTMDQEKINAGAPVVSQRYASRVAANALTNEQAKIDNVPAAITKEYADRIANNEIISQQAKISAGAPELQYNTMYRSAMNEKLMTNAQQEAGVAAINYDIARSRAEASRDAQEYKLAYEQYSSLPKVSDGGVVGRKETFGEMLRSSNTGTGAGARARAAFDSLFKTGDVAELLEVMDGANLSAMDKNVRDSLVQSAAASGNALLKGWAKTNGSMSLADYIKSGSADKNSGWNAYITESAGEHVLDNMDKDTISFLAGKEAAEHMPAAAIKNAWISAANQNQTSRTALGNITKGSGKLAEIGAEFSPADLTKLSLEGVQAINSDGTNHLQAAVDEINKPGNETLRASIKDSVKKALGIVDDGPAGSPAPDGGPAPGGGPEDGPSGGGPAPASSGSGSTAPGGDFESQYFERYGGGSSTSSGSDATPAPDTTSGPVPAPESQQPAQPRQQPSPSAAEIARERTGLKTWAPVDILRNAINNGTGVFLDAAAEELASRPRVPLTRDDLTSMTNPTILRKLIDSGNPNHIRSIVTASRDLENDPAALQALAPDVRYAIDEARTMRGMTGLPS